MNQKKKEKAVNVITFLLYLLNSLRALFSSKAKK